MARKTLNEGNFVIDFVKAVFDAVVNQRNRALQRAAEKDPEFKRLTTSLQKTHDEMVKWAEEKAKSEPETAKYLKVYKDLGMM